MKMNKNQLRSIAESTVLISDTGLYRTSEGGPEVDIRILIEDCVAGTRIVSAEGLAGIPTPNSAGGPAPEISVADATTLDAAEALLHETGRPPCILVFASAKHPGGGFLNGMMAQEEDIAYRTTLYKALGSVPGYYKESVANLNNSLYFNKAVYTEGLVVMRDSEYELTAPWVCNAITAPAPNRGAALAKNIPESAIEQAMEERIDLVLRAMISAGEKNIVLGAFGCGVFRNNAGRVAEIFHEALFAHGLGMHFAKIVFAIPGEAGENHMAFRKVFASGQTNRL